MADPAPFKYSIVPAAIPYTVDAAKPIVVEITVQATNQSAQQVDCPQIQITVPTGHNSLDSGTLTVQPERIVVAPGARTPWAVFPGGGGTWYATPVPPATGLEPGATVSFVCSQVAVNMAPGRATLSITQMTADGPDQTTLQASASVDKRPSATG